MSSTNQSFIYVNGKKWILEQPHQSVPTQATQSLPTQANQDSRWDQLLNIGNQLSQTIRYRKWDQLKDIENQLKQLPGTTFAPTCISQATNTLTSLNSDPNGCTNNTGATSHMIRTDIDYEKQMEEFESELSKIVGLEELKLQLRKWSKGLLMDVKRRAMGIKLGPKKAPHMAFLGNPGTGKTTVARVLGKLLHSVGVLSSNKVTEVQRSDLVGQYVGNTALKTKLKIKEAKGGVLFVDEAYRLVPEYTAGKTDFGSEALEEIMSVLEDDNLVVIFAGYTEPMKRVLSSNQGFFRRVTHIYEFDDFSCDELTEMVMIKMNKQDEKSPLFGFKLHPLCTIEAIREVIEKNSSEKLRSKMNGGLVDHMLNNAKENLDSRLNIKTTDNVDELMTITLDDLEVGLQILAHRVKVD